MKGSCLCGDVSYEVTPPFKFFQYCHCSRCRKVSGSAHASNLLIAPEQFQWISGEELVGRFEEKNAKYFASSFCKKCGSSMPWLAQGGKNRIVPAGTLDDDPGIRPQQSIFYASKACWYEQVSDLPQYTTLPGK